MANRCKNRITVIGLQEAPETFVKTLSMEMLGIDLDNPKLELWGEQNTGIYPQSWYHRLADEYRTQGCYAARYDILYVEESYERLGVTAPQFYVETKWATPVEKVRKASKVFPELIFHVEWVLLQDGPSGEYVMKNGDMTESIVRRGSWYLFDDLFYPIVSLLPAYMSYTLAQRGVLRFEDAILILEGIRRTLDDQRFTDSPYQSLRNRSKVKKTRKALDALIQQMKDTARQLDFKGVLLDDSWCEEEFALRWREQTDFDDKQPSEEALDMEAIDEGIEQLEF